MRICVLGAGIIGLACAYELLSRGHRVEVVDPDPGKGASYAAAGMLCPSGEFWPGEADLLRLGLASARMWPSFAAALGVPLHRTGTLLVGADRADLQEIERQTALLDRRGIRVAPLGRSDLLAREPGLSRVAGGSYLPDDHSVDPRAVVTALLTRVPVVAAPSQPAEVRVLATGAHLPEPFTPLVRPVRGEILRLRTNDPPRQVIRGLVHGAQVYVVPRAGSDEVVIGATSYEQDGPPIPTVEGVHRLLDAARRLLPGLDRAEFTEAMARDRPGTKDNLPLIGASQVDGVWLAGGHYRHGVLLAPLTAHLIAESIEHGTTDQAVDPRRFTRGELTE